MSRLPNDNLHVLATQTALYVGPTLLGPQGGTDRALLAGLTEACFELLGQIGRKLCRLDRVRFIDIQREGLWLAEQLTSGYMRPVADLLEVETQHYLRAMILRSLRCMLVVSDEQFVVLKSMIQDWAGMLHNMVSFTAAYGGRKALVA
ncbi:hypothetical protein FAES_1803 [Fibrella aestuarina BUZ 2]|uniref:Uncharacterized protein n=1 Tax=Fibrella aestuarina BUZ 2 TaxID=1166018 RepID=I0K6R0_9BACT|nr:hypothetical protein [Fibrella aestuarina]CCG99813.1 hypothetical protein FAES_1803 [Fibrella aestuarina BUZ 2]